MKKTEEKDQSLDYKSLIKKVTENGDLCVLGMKGTCKTTLLMHLARTIREDSHNHLIVFETFPKWIFEFDSISYLVVKDSDVQPKENLPYLEEDRSIIQWTKDFNIVNAEKVTEFLKQNKDCIFLIECQEMERISAFMTFVIYTVYRRQYLRAKAETLNKLNLNYWFLCEEAHNLMDSTILAKTQFNKLRKMQAEFRNLRMHLICVTIRLQNLSPKLRSTMSLILSRVSLDDYQLKIRNLLRNSAFKDVITSLPKGQFVYPELDLKLETQPFIQNGKPYLWQYVQPKTQQPLTQNQKWRSYHPLKKAFLLLSALVTAGTSQPQQLQNNDKELEENIKEDEQGDFLALDNEDLIFSEEE